MVTIIKTCNDCQTQVDYRETHGWVAIEHPYYIGEMVCADCAAAPGFNPRTRVTGPNGDSILR